MPLNVFACFCNISFVFMHFVRLCVCALPLWHALAPCMVHGIGMHVMHHIIVVMFVIMFMMFIMMMIIDRHDIHRSLFVVQSLIIDH